MPKSIKDILTNPVAIAIFIVLGFIALLYGYAFLEYETQKHTWVLYTVVGGGLLAAIYFIFYRSDKYNI